MSEELLTIKLPFALVDRIREIWLEGHVDDERSLEIVMACNNAIYESKEDPSYFVGCSCGYAEEQGADEQRHHITGAEHIDNDTFKCSCGKTIYGKVL